MKKILALLFIAASLVAQAQTNSTSSKFGVRLYIVLPDNTDTIHYSELSKIETKLQKIVAQQGVSGSGYNSDFVLYPKFEVYDEQTLDGGMQPMIIIKGELSLFIKQVSTNAIYGVTTVKLNGSGYKRSESIKEAIRSLNTNDPILADFIVKTKQKIVAYYDQKCADVMAKAERDYKANLFESAILEVSSIPSECKCFAASQDKFATYYKAYQNNNCSKFIQTGAALFANHDFNSALGNLILVDPSSKCGQESLDLIKKIGEKVNADEKKAFDAAMKIHADAIALENQRLINVQQIALKLFEKMPVSHYNYNYIVK